MTRENGKNFSDASKVYRSARPMNREVAPVMSNAEFKRSCEEIYQACKDIPKGLFKNREVDSSQLAFKIAELTKLQDRLALMHEQGHKTTQENLALIVDTKARVETARSFLLEIAKSLKLDQQE